MSNAGMYKDGYENYLYDNHVTISCSFSQDAPYD